MKQKVFKKRVSNQAKQLNMNCSVVRKKLIFYIEGELESQEREQVSQHLADCEQCYHLYEKLQSTMKIAEKRKPIEPNPFLYTRIKERLDAMEKTKQRTEIPVYQKILRPIILSLVLLLGLYGGNRLGNFYESSQIQTYSTPSTEYYLNDMQQERLEVLLLND